MVTQPSSEMLDELLLEDGEQAAWWGTWVECAVAISRLKREGGLDEETGEEASVRLNQLAQDWTEMEPRDDTRLLASIISKYHPLKAADALQLAAALRWCEGDTDGAGFVCLDERLRLAVSDEGFE